MRGTVEIFLIIIISEVSHLVKGLPEVIVALRMMLMV